MGNAMNAKTTANRLRMVIFMVTTKTISKIGTFTVSALLHLCSALRNNCDTVEVAPKHTHKKNSAIYSNAAIIYLFISFVLFFRFRLTAAYGNVKK